MSRGRIAGVIRCEEETCNAEIPNSKWSKVKSEWFQQKDGRSWCPKHTPSWVAEWRSRKGKK